MKTRADVMRERREAEARAGGGASDGWVKCPGCSIKQKLAPDGLCISCGARLTVSGPAVTGQDPRPVAEPDPAMLRPDSAETKAAVSMGALVLALKQAGFDVTLALAEKWTPKELEAATAILAAPKPLKEVPVFLMGLYRGPGKVEGARPPRVPDESPAGPKVVTILEQKGVEVVDLEPKGQGDPRQVTVDEVVSRQNKQPMGGDLGPMTELLGRLHWAGGKLATLPLLAKMDPGQRNLMSELLEIDQKAGKFRGLDKFPSYGAQFWPNTRIDSNDHVAEDEEGTTVQATWAEEKYTLVKDSFSTVSVGPFSATATVGPGETTDMVRTRLYTGLVVFAEAERRRKLDSFAKALVEAKAAAKSA